MLDLKLGLNDKIGLEKESQIKSRPTKSYQIEIFDSRAGTELLDMILTKL
ncbi:unnamed protein product [Camellia sinensis]